MDLNPIDVMKTIPALLPYVPYVLMALGVCAMLMPWLPPPANPRSAYGIFYAVMNAIAQNYRNSRNAGGPGTPTP
jgi:hypothetical protein